MSSDSSAVGGQVKLLFNTGIILHWLCFAVLTSYKAVNKSLKPIFYHIIITRCYVFVGWSFTSAKRSEVSISLADEFIVCLSNEPGVNTIIKFFACFMACNTLCRDFASFERFCTSMNTLWPSMSKYTLIKL